MKKTILVTGATDGLGLLTAKKLLALGHTVLLHGRNPDKLNKVIESLPQYAKQIEGYIADLSNLKAVKELAKTITDKHETLDVLINNAGILKSPSNITKDELDVRFAVNTLAPYLLTKVLMPLFSHSSRVVNLSSAAQASVELAGLSGKKTYPDPMAAYAQSKLALTMWSVALANETKENGPIIIAVNPGSLLASKMVKEGFGVAGNDLSIGADVLVKAALSEEFNNANGKYFDNDVGVFNEPLPDAQDQSKVKAVLDTIEDIIKNI